MPRIHYTADTVYVIAGYPGPVFIHARMAEPIEVPECCARHAVPASIHAPEPPVDSDGVCVSEVVVHPAAKLQHSRCFTGPTH